MRSSLRRSPLAAVAVVLALAWPGSLARADQLLEARLSTPPHAPVDAPDVIVHVPSHLDVSAPIAALVFLHGFSSCARALMASQPVACSKGGRPQRAYGLAQLHERAGTNSLLIVPQLAFLARDANAPRFAAKGGLDALLRELTQGLLQPVLRGQAQLERVTLLAHSAGYRAAALILRDASRQVAVHNLVLFDALYAHWDVFAHWYKQAPQERRIVSFYTRDAQTTRGHARLLAALGMDARVATGQPTRQARDARISLQRVDTPHSLVPEKHMEDALRSLFGTRSAR